MPLSINVETLRLQSLLFGGEKLGGIHRAAKAKLESLGLSPIGFQPFERLGQGDSCEVGLNSADIVRWIESVELPVMVEKVVAPSIPAVAEIKAEDGTVTTPAVAEIPAVIESVPATREDANRLEHLNILGQLVATLNSRL